jgi:acyl-coenzyme A synthetase/AMP-(fatty) acid ligase
MPNSMFRGRNEDRMTFVKELPKTAIGKIQK